MPKAAVVIGTGYIGLDMPDALTHRSLKITLISRRDPVAPMASTLAPGLSRARPSALWFLTEFTTQRNKMRLKARPSV